MGDAILARAMSWLASSPLDDVVNCVIWAFGTCSANSELAKLAANGLFPRVFKRCFMPGRELVQSAADLPAKLLIKSVTSQSSPLTAQDVNAVRAKVKYQLGTDSHSLPLLRTHCRVNMRSQMRSTRKSRLPQLPRWQTLTTF